MTVNPEFWSAYPIYIKNTFVEEQELN